MTPDELERINEHFASEPNAPTTIEIGIDLWLPPGVTANVTVNEYNQQEPVKTDAPTTENM